MNIKLPAPFWVNDTTVSRAKHYSSNTAEVNPSHHRDDAHDPSLLKLQSITYVR